MTSQEFPYLNRVVIIGRLVREPELRQTGAGVPVANFKIACRKRFAEDDEGPREETCYVGVAAWQNLAERCHEALAKGAVVRIEGELKSRVRDNGRGIKRSFVEIRAQSIGLWQGEDSFAPLEDSTPAKAPTVQVDIPAQPVAALTERPEPGLAVAVHGQTEFEEYNVEPEEL